MNLTLKCQYIPQFPRTWRTSSRCGSSPRNGSPIGRVGRLASSQTWKLQRWRMSPCLSSNSSLSSADLSRYATWRYFYQFNQLMFRLFIFLLSILSVFWLEDFIRLGNGCGELKSFTKMFWKFTVANNRKDLLCLREMIVSRVVSFM